jgi:hypothetical protein
MRSQDHLPGPAPSEAQALNAALGDGFNGRLTIRMIGASAQSQSRINLLAPALSGVGMPYLCVWVRKATRALICVAESDWPKLVGITLVG